MSYDLKFQSSIGIVTAFLILSLWIMSLGLLLSTKITQLAPLIILIAVLGRTFIQTGLFIVAHDAIHGVIISNTSRNESSLRKVHVAQRNRRLNNVIGQLAVFLYALLSYRKLFLNHWRHHRYSGRLGDPDFHHGGYIIWYLKFIRGYFDVKQVVIQFFGMGTLFLILLIGYHIAIINLILFWVLPIFLSTMQLFFFGTYLPHRSSNLENSYQVTSTHYPIIWSFLTCYHFGYHWEHHQYPSLPWYKLPSVRKK